MTVSGLGPRPFSSAAHAADSAAPVMPPFKRAYDGAKEEHLWAVAKSKVANLDAAIKVTIDESSHTIRGHAEKSMMSADLTFTVSGNELTVVVEHCSFPLRSPLKKAVQKLLERVPEALAANP